MAIKAVFPAGTTTVKVDALHQWDYGQTLEIESADLPSIVEVHFACPDMNEAIVHNCSVADGVATVAIPNRCLEQSSNITAWVYEISGNTGSTTKTIVIPVVARTRPSRSGEIPQEILDRYTELIGEVNEVIEKLVSGEITVGQAAKALAADKATTADSAGFATSAGTATSATNASSAAHAESAKYATSAGNATTATKATNDAYGNAITTYARFDGSFTLFKYGSTSLREGATYQFKVIIGSTNFYAILPYSAVSTNITSLGWVEGIQYDLVLQDKDSVGHNEPIISGYDGTEAVINPDAVVYYRQI